MIPPPDPFRDCQGTGSFGPLACFLPCWDGQLVGMAAEVCFVGTGYLMPVSEARLFARWVIVSTQQLSLMVMLLV
jgi:hypothetical protein